MYSTKNVSVAGTKVGQFVNYGIQMLRINSIELQTAKSSPSKRALFNMETPPIEVEGFVGLDGAKGQVGRVTTAFMKTKEREQEFIQKVTAIAEKLGVRTELDAATEKVSNLEEFVAAANKIVVGKFGWFVITAEEYNRPGKKPGITLHFARYNFAASIEEGSGKLEFDKSKPYHYKPLTTASSESEFDTTSKADILL